jgi:hypothetical protein
MKTKAVPLMDAHRTPEKEGAEVGERPGGLPRGSRWPLAGQGGEGWSGLTSVGESRAHQSKSQGWPSGVATGNIVVLVDRQTKVEPVLAE